MNNKGINLQFSMVLKGKGAKTNAAQITYSCEDYVQPDFRPTHAHGKDYGFCAKTTFSAYHNHFSDNPEEGQGSHAPGV